MNVQASAVQLVMQHALDHHRAGRLAEAEALYRQVLQQQPDHADALHNLGLLAHQVGRHDVALDLIRRALVLCPAAPHYHLNLGQVWLSMGKLDEAAASCRAAIRLNPDYAEAHYNAGVLLHRQAKWEEAIQFYRRAIALAPGFAPAYNNLATALENSGHLTEAAECYRQAIALRPESAEAHNNLAHLLQNQGDHRASMEHLRQAIAIKTDYVEAHVNLGNALSSEGRIEEAIRSYRRALEIDPNNADARSNLGNALKEQGRLDEAVECYTKAIALRPDFAEAHSNLGNTLRQQGRFDAAIDECRKAIAVNGEHAAHVNLALVLLLLGRWEEGWPQYEWRLRDPALARSWVQPRWDGSDVKGATILLHAEQGFGDTIQFVRYAPLIAARGAKVILECQPELASLLASVAGVAQVVPRGQPLPEFDLHLPLLSCPLVFSTTPQTVPAHVPYVHPDAARVRRWRERLAADGPGLKVGLAWGGNPAQPHDRYRSMPLSALAPLAGVPGVRFYSLQKGEPAKQTAAPAPGMHLTDWTQDLGEFADTAALMASLDLVISVCTSVTHLAGALARPAWTPLAFVADWRWLRGRDDTPWYATMRLFRQTTPGDWDGVVRTMAEQLRTTYRNV